MIGLRRISSAVSISAFFLCTGQACRNAKLPKQEAASAQGVSMQPGTGTLPDVAAVERRSREIKIYELSDARVTNFKYYPPGPIPGRGTVLNPTVMGDLELRFKVEGNVCLADLETLAFNLEALPRKSFQDAWVERLAFSISKKFEPRSGKVCPMYSYKTILTLTVPLEDTMFKDSVWERKIVFNAKPDREDARDQTIVLKYSDKGYEINRPVIERPSVP